MAPAEEYSMQLVLCELFDCLAMLVVSGERGGSQHNCARDGVTVGQGLHTSCLVGFVCWGPPTILHSPTQQTVVKTRIRDKLSVADHHLSSLCSQLNGSIRIKPSTISAHFQHLLSHLSQYSLTCTIIHFTRTYLYTTKNLIKTRAFFQVAQLNYLFCPYPKAYD